MSGIDQLVDGVQFIDRNHGHVMIKRWTDGNVWLFKKHPDGQWVSQRKVSDHEASTVLLCGWAHWAPSV